MFFSIAVSASDINQRNQKSNEDLWNASAVPLYIGLLVIYYAFKYGLKRSARWIDKAIIIPNFSFEIITEILISSLYWSNFRIFCLRYEIYDDEAISYGLFALIALIHLFSELFQNYGRMTAAYFNWKCTHRKSDKKSNITQWKVRGAIDTSVRFIIAIYSFLFSMVLFGTFAISDKVSHSDKSIFRWQAVILNCGVFVFEMAIFLPIIFIPGCAGKISDQQQFNMAEPLMRLYNAKRVLFMCLFCGSLTIASLLTF